MKSPLDKFYKRATSSKSAYLVSSRENIRYISGFGASLCFILIMPKEKFLITDFRYIQEAKKVKGFSAVRIKKSWQNQVLKLCENNSIKKLFFEKEALSYAAYNKLQKDVTRALAYKPLRLTGNEIHFIRQYFKMTLAEFGDRFSVSHPAVIKWEDSKDDATAMKWSVEKDIRLFILDRMGCKAGVIGELYLELKKEAKRGTKPIQMNLAA